MIEKFSNFSDTVYVKSFWKNITACIIQIRVWYVNIEKNISVCCFQNYEEDKTISGDCDLAANWKFT